jgi:hypothetical protein
MTLPKQALYMDVLAGDQFGPSLADGVVDPLFFPPIIRTKMHLRWPRQRTALIWARFSVSIHKINIISSHHHEDPFLFNPRFGTIVCSSTPRSRRHVVVVAIERRRRRTGGCLCGEGRTLHVVVVGVVSVASTRRDDEESTNDLRHSHTGTP